jgi:hypothetical protein
MRGSALALAAAVLALVAPPAFAQDGRGVSQPTAPGQNTTSGSDIDRDADAKREARRKRGGKTPAAAPDGSARGMAEAPAIVQAAGLRCTVAGANFIGSSKGGESLYEVACSDGPGYVLIANADKTLKEGYECLQLRDGNAMNAAAGKANPNPLTCKLPGNANLVANVAKVTASLLPGCQADQARWMGTSVSTKENNYEIGCAGQPGAIVKIAAPGGTTQPSAIPCLKISPEGNAQCEYTSQQEKLAAMQGLVKASNKAACQASDMRYVGSSTTSKEDFYEVKCAAGEGFMLVGNAQGGVARTIECSRAQGVSGGCTLTDAVAAQNAEAGIYKGLAQKAGFNCDVGQYRLLGMETTTKREVVELACKNLPEGVIGFFPAAAGGKIDLYDCTKNWRHKQTCSLTKLDAIKPRLTKDISKYGKTCDVTAYRGAGMTTKAKTEFVEVACAAGSGLMIEYAAEGAPLFAPATGVFTCAEATNIGEGCKLGGAARRS